MRFKEAIIKQFDIRSRSNRLSGRASRSEFWYWRLFVAVISIVCALIDKKLLHVEGRGILANSAMIALLLPDVAISVRRLHDTNRSGWWLLGLGLLIAASGFSADCLCHSIDRLVLHQGHHGP
jgi:uncharacterized membrane protein YhaH (DUF805 family)